MAILLGKEHFIWRGVGRVEAEQFLPFFSVALICRSFFFLDNCTRIFIAFYHSPRFISLESSTLVPVETVVVLCFNISS